MMNKLSCNVVRDLLPSYIEKITSDSTNEEIEAHLNECRECREILRDMTGGEKNFNENSKKEINYLKKVSRKTKAIVISIAAFFLIALAVPFAKYCIIGVNDTFFYTDSLSVNGSELHGEGGLLSSAGVVSKVRCDYDDGVVTLNVYDVLPIVKKDGNFSFNIDYKAEGEITRVQKADGSVLWEDIYISDRANSLFDSKVKYVGNNSDVCNLVKTALHSSALDYSDCKIHLITEAEPYGVEVYDFYPIGECTDEAVDNDMAKTAYTVLANIDNADFVRIKYRVPSGPEKTFELSAEVADKKLKYDIKEKAKTVKGLQLMLDDLDKVYGEINGTD